MQRFGARERRRIGHKPINMTADVRAHTHTHKRRPRCDRSAILIWKIDMQSTMDGASSAPLQLFLHEIAFYWAPIQSHVKLGAN